DKFKNVKEFYTAELTDETNPLLERYKKKITIAYLLENPKERSTNLNVNKLIKEFKKTSIYERDLIDLMLHRVECGVAAFRRNANRTATFYNCIFSSFEDAVKLISGNDLLPEFKTRINKIIQQSETGKFGIRERMKDITEEL
ncbi:MAG TPA: DUF6155 family protein, partial [Bacteroidia bacterium]|nr:DUF6155 family protein [Bacteroidia bacterium]